MIRHAGVVCYDWLMDVIPAFVDETGVLTQSPREQPVYGIGLLLVNDPSEVTDRFYKLYFNVASERSSERSRLRREIKQEDRSPTLQEIDHLMWSTRHPEYKFTDVATHNVQQYIDLLNLYFSLDCFEFHALLVDRTDPDFSLSNWSNDPWKAYVDLGRSLLERRLAAPVFALVDFQAKPNRSLVNLEDEFCSVEFMKGCLRASSETQIFLQLVDVLIGCVQADYKEKSGFYSSNSRRAIAKKRLVDFVRSKLSLPSDQPMVSQERPIWETKTPSPFTVWLKAESVAMSGAHPA